MKQGYLPGRLGSSFNQNSCQAVDWDKMEKHKCSAGYMEPYLVFYQNQLCGAVSFAPGRQLGRLKNLVIHPNWRRLGIGVEIAKFVSRYSNERGLQAAGCFALESGPATRLYSSAGYIPVTYQVEWYRQSV